VIKISTGVVIDVQAAPYRKLLTQNGAIPLKKIALLTAAAALVLSSMTTAMPVAAQETGSGPNPFSDCGIGAALFPEVPIAAVLSNVIWDVGVTAVISAVSSKDTCNGKRETAALYITNTYAGLEIDAAKGQGPYLAALASVMNCNDSAKTELYRAARVGLADTMSRADFGKMTHVEKAERLFNVVDKAATTDLAGRCYVS
jgi:hypothetical protein